MHPDDLTDVQRGRLIQIHRLITGKSGRWHQNKGEGGEQLKGGEAKEEDKEAEEGETSTRQGLVALIWWSNHSASSAGKARIKLN